MKKQNLKSKILKMKGSKGITLVALIITIIVLLILAVVAISAVNNTGIIQHAQNSADEYTDGRDKENTVLGSYLEILKEHEPGENTSQGGEDKIKYTEEGVPVPVGFKVVTGTKDTGLVIENETEGSQFVWVPVENINTMVMCKSKTASDQCSIKLNEDKTALLCETHNGSTDICGKLYGYSSMVNIFDSGKTDQTYTSFSNKEPYNLSGETDTTYQVEFNEMALSVAKNGGFYVGRYEVSKNGDKAQSKSDGTNITSATAAVDSANTWYGLYELCKTYNTSSVKSSMIWGSQYDAMMIWMGQTSSNSVPGYNKTQNPGTDPLDVIRNVYDLYGSSYEWTLEAYNTSYRASRGGWYNGGSPSSKRGCIIPNDTESTKGCRLALYIDENRN